MSHNKTFCILPWMHLATTSTGKYRPCCNIAQGTTVTKDDGSHFNVWEDSIEAMWDSSYMQQLRAKMLAGKKSRVCKRCYREEDSGIESARQSANSRYMFNYDAVINPPVNIKYLDLRLGNLCNLKCRMCNPYASSMWTKEWNLIADKDKQLSDTQLKYLKNMTWPDDPFFWDQIDKHSIEIDEIYLTGGEPTLITKQYELYNSLIAKGLAHKIKLKYNTNLTNIPDKLVDYWRYFKQVKLNASIDAYGDLDRYIRYPSSWKKIDENLKKFIAMGNIKIEVHCTVQIYNILRLNELFDYLEPLKLPVYLNILNHPEELNIRVLPEHLKDQAALYLEKHYDLVIRKKDKIADYMYKEDWSHLLPKFKNYTDTLDKSREESIYNLIEEFRHVA
jgi:MoaA/NifB/PqqE/SkfB family radical SAM enzyme|tara:strand:+ start:2022 stop:3194 length:1173 start_codon:yes stop_codon:yes gene_type:complete